MRRNNNNLSLLLISFVVAVVVWIFVMNAAKPLVDDFKNIPIEIEMEGNQTMESLGRIFVLDDTKSVRLRYKVRSDLASEIRLNDIRAYVLVSNTIANAEYLPVHIQYLNTETEKNISNVTVYPQVVSVASSDLETRYYSVNYKTQGKLPEGQSVGNVTISPSGISISGRKEDLDEIGSARIDIDLNGHNDTFVNSNNIKIYDRNGKPLRNQNDLILGTEKATFTVIVHENKLITLSPNVEGEVANGCTFENIEIIPDKILVTGPRANLDEINTLDLPPVDIQGVTESKDLDPINIEDIIPTGLKYVGEDTEIRVHINVSGSANVIIAPKVVEEE